MSESLKVLIAEYKMKSLVIRSICLLSLGLLLQAFLIVNSFAANGNAPFVESLDLTTLTGTSTPPVVFPEAVIRETRKKIKKYLLSKKYKIDNDVFTNRFYMTPYGPSGGVLLRGEINLKNKPVAVSFPETVEEKKTWARQIAKVLFLEEAELLGTASLNEIRETNIDYEPDRVFLRYQRYIGELPLNDVFIRIEVGPNGSIVWVDAELAPAPPELYEAVKRKTLSEKEIGDILADKLRAEGVDTTREPGLFDYGKYEKVALPDPPYVAWKVKTMIIFLLDAFTGEILQRRSNVRN
jgi:hypothetical protein